MKLTSIITIITTILLALPTSAKIIQNGIILEYNGSARKTPLSGVSIWIKNAQKTATHDDGKFSLTFNTLDTYGKAEIREIYKSGYEIFNIDETRNWNLNPKENWEIILCKSEYLKNLWDNYMSQASITYKKQREKELNEIDLLRKKSKITEIERQQMKNLIEEKYELQIDSLVSYIDRIVRFDMEKLTKDEKEIISLIQAGKLNEAIALENNLRMIEVLESKYNDLNESILLTKRQIDRLVFFGGKDNLNTAIKNARYLANKDTTDIDWIEKTITLIDNYGNPIEAIEYQKILLNNYMKQVDPENSYVFYHIARIQEAIGNRLRDAQRIDEAFYYLKSSLENQAKAINGDYLGFSMTREIDLADKCRSLGLYYKEIKKFDEAIYFLKKSCALHDDNKDLSKYISDYHWDLCIAKNYLDMGDISATNNLSEGLKYYDKVKKIDSNLEYIPPYSKTENPYLTDLNYQMGWTYFKLGNFEVAERLAMECIRFDEKFKNDYGWRFPFDYTLLGSVMGESKRHDEAIACFKKALEYDEADERSDSRTLTIDYKNIGLAYYDKGSYMEAIDYYKNALQENSNLENTFPIEYLENLKTISQQLCETYINLENLEDGLRHIESALDVDDKDIQSLDLKCFVLHKLDNCNEASTLWKQILEINGSSDLSNLKSYTLFN